MAKKNKDSAKNLADYASDLSELYPADVSEMFNASTPIQGTQPPPAESTGCSVQVTSTVNKHAMRRVLLELALEKELPWTLNAA